MSKPVGKRTDDAAAVEELRREAGADEFQRVADAGIK